jgi:hypothetical protein
MHGRRNVCTKASADDGRGVEFKVTMTQFFFKGEGFHENPMLPKGSL